MSGESEPVYDVGWRPERPRWRLFPLVVSWLATGVALMVAAGLLPGVHIDGFWGALLVAAVAAARASSPAPTSPGSPSSRRDSDAARRPGPPHFMPFG